MRESCTDSNEANWKQLRGDGMKIAMIIAILAACALLMPALVRTPQAIEQSRQGPTRRSLTEPIRHYGSSWIGIEKGKPFCLSPIVRQSIACLHSQRSLVGYRLFRIVGLIPSGLRAFYRLMAQMRTRHPDESQLMLLVFDLLHQDGVDLRGLPLSERKRDLPPALRQVARAVLEGGANLPERPASIRSLQQVRF